MNPSDLATMLVQAGFTMDQVPTMLAILWAESGLKPTAKGDPIENYSGATREQYEPYSCAGYNAFGIGQVFLYWHRDKLESATGSADPCTWADWLEVPANNIVMCRLIWLESNFAAWSAYNNGAYEAHLPAAEVALAQAFAANDPSPGLRRHFLLTAAIQQLDQLKATLTDLLTQDIA